MVISPWLPITVSFACVDYAYDQGRWELIITVAASGHYKEEYQNNMVMRNPYAEEYQNDKISQIYRKISRMRKRLKPGILSSAHECQVRG